MDRDINTIPTTPRYIVGYKIYVEWNDNPKLVADDIGEDVTVQELEEDHGIFIEEDEDGKTNRT